MSDTPPEKDEVTQDDVVLEPAPADEPAATPTAEAPEEPAVDDDALGDEPESGTGDSEPAIPEIPAEGGASSDEDDDEPGAQASASAEPVAAAPSKPARRPRSRSRQGSETAPAQPAPRRDGPKPVVRAQAKYVRSSARKARLVCDHIRGKSVEEARSILAHIPRSVAEDWQKLLESAVANAEHNHELLGDDLKVLAIYADEGPTLKRFRPRAMGRASRIRKRTSHLTIQLTPKD